MPVNVSPEANAAFMRALEREDPMRFASLTQSMRHSAVRSRDRAANTRKRIRQAKAGRASARMSKNVAGAS